MAKTPCPRVCILVADDFEPFRRTVCALLQARPEWKVVAEASDGLQAVHMAKELLPEVIVLDIGMPVLNGIEAAKRIRRGSPNSKIIFATQNEDTEIREAALGDGAAAYLLKANAVSELVPAIEAALKNGQRPGAHCSQ